MEWGCSHVLGAYFSGLESVTLILEIPPILLKVGGRETVPK